MGACGVWGFRLLRRCVLGLISSCTRRGARCALAAQVCGLKWSPDGNQLASGGNDNVLNIWDGVHSSAVAATTSRHRLTAHTAAVKALAWCPWQKGTLASGGGTADRCIRFWNASTGAQLNSIDTGSQVRGAWWGRLAHCRLLHCARSRPSLWFSPLLHTA